MVQDPARERTPRPRTPHQAVVEADTRTPVAELKASFLRLMRDDRPKVAIPRDIVLVLLFLFLVLGGLWAYTGQDFPTTSPLVVVESGSMMHPDAPYGRVGTIDPGDLVLVKAVDGPGDVETAYGGRDRLGYGGQGDVIVYRPDNRPGATPIIHRAMTWVEVTQVPTEDGVENRYSYHDESGELLTNQRSVTLESIGVIERRFAWSGFVTKGDNPDTNRVADQVSHVPDRTVAPEWLVGKARGEIPWIGLVKLALSGNPVPSEAEEQCKVLAAWAPCDTWVMLGLSVGALLVVPFGLEKAYQSSPLMRRWFR